MEINFKKQPVIFNGFGVTPKTAKQAKKFDFKADSTLTGGSNESSYCERFCNWIIDLFKCIFCCGCKSEDSIPTVKAQIAELIKIRVNSHENASEHPAQYSKIMGALPQAVKEEIREVALQFYAYKDVIKKTKGNYQKTALDFNSYVTAKAESVKTWVAENGHKHSLDLVQLFTQHDDVLFDHEAILEAYSLRLDAQIPVKV